ncbi:MAG: hypothetical protein PWP27_2242 [Clostridiales bacterium]|jgi:hypothetical protein|nr:hypothetical protein [Clostridiales bacterium]MDK2934432.1 hypothetical protein [Clostridiales bacterium]
MISSKLLLAYLGEGLLMAYVGVGLLAIKLNYKKIFAIGIIYALSIYLVRSIYKIFNIPLGIHTIILLYILALLIKYIGKVGFLQSVIAMFLVEGLSVIGETMFAVPYIMWLGIPFEDVFDTWYIVIAAYLSYVPMIIMAILIKTTNFQLIDLNRNSRHKGEY